MLFLEPHCCSGQLEDLTWETKMLDFSCMASAVSADSFSPGAGRGCSGPCVMSHSVTPDLG